jgi:hypothetical protein
MSRLGLGFISFPFIRDTRTPADSEKKLLIIQSRRAQDMRGP